MVFRQTPLYRFLYFCCESGFEKSVLDCGAGGDMPPLALFLEYGFKPLGIELSERQIEKAKVFSKTHEVELNIQKGDIRELPFPNESVSHVYSYNTIFHMCKADIIRAAEEIKRVMRPGGLCFINFLSVEDSNCGAGEKVGNGEYLQSEGDEKIMHTYYEPNEAEKHFRSMDILYKENRILERIFEGRKIRQGYIDYIARKR
jgi:SAM-dependent methyltransferase